MNYFLSRLRAARKSVAITDPYFANVVLLMPFESGFNDIKGHVVTVYGTPQLIAPSIAGYGTKSADFSGATTNYLTLADSDDFYLTATHTVEFWCRPSASDLDWGLHEIYSQRAPSGGYQIGFYQNQFFHWWGSWWTLFGGVLSASNIYHVAVVYSAIDNQARFYVNGILVLTITPPPVTNLSAIVEIGTNYGYGQHYKGKLKDLRVTKGVARYNSNFAPPAAFYPQA